MTHITCVGTRLAFDRFCLRDFGRYLFVCLQMREGFERPCQLSRLKPGAAEREARIGKRVVDTQSALQFGNGVGQAPGVQQCLSMGQGERGIVRSKRRDFPRRLKIIRQACICHC